MFQLTDVLYKIQTTTGGREGRRGGRKRVHLHSVHCYYWSIVALINSIIAMVLIGYNSGEISHTLYLCFFGFHHHIILKFDHHKITNTWKPFLINRLEHLLKRGREEGREGEERERRKEGRKSSPSLTLIPHQFLINIRQKLTIKSIRLLIIRIMPILSLY